MTINIQGINLDLTSSLKKFVNEKVNTVNKLLAKIDKDDVVMLDVEIERTTNHHRKGEVYRTVLNMSLPGKNLLRAEETKEDVRRSIIDAVSALEREIRKYKTKKFDVPKRKARKAKREMREM